MQEQERFEKYTPQFPLPTDISSMSRQDTICKFCGVSYLIHNEIKALEAKCQKLEADLAHYAGTSSREAALEQALQKEKARAADLESTAAINSHKLNEINRKLQLAQDQLHQSETAHEATRTSFRQCSQNIQRTHRQIATIREECVSLKEHHAKEAQDSQRASQTMKITLQKEIQSTIDKYAKQIHERQKEIDQYHQQLDETKQSLRDIQVKHQQSQLDSKESQTKVQHDLEAAREETRIHQSELSRVRQQLSQVEQARDQLHNEIGDLKQQCRQLEQQISEKDQSKKNVDLLVDQYRQQINDEKQLRTKTNEELGSLRAKLSQLTLEYEQLDTAKKDLETNELNSRRKTDEANRSRQAILDRTRDEYEKLLRKYNDLDEVYRELVTQKEKDASESQLIRRELERLHTENIEFTKQKETTQITHDIQMKKLRDSYATKLREAEQWPDRLQAELKHERDQHRTQLAELERRLKENFAAELDIERQKTSGLLRKYEQESGHSTLQLRHELISTEKVTIEQRQYYEQQIEQLHKDKVELKKELDTLRDVLKELHEQSSKQDAASGDRMHSLKLKEDLLSKENELFQAQSTITELKKELEQGREEMSTLQETVHRECTEREQLKDALIEARQQLLTLKKNGVLNGTASRSLHSPPVAFEEIERRVAGPLPFTPTQNPPLASLAAAKNPSFIQSEPPSRDSSIHGDAADLMARPMSSTQNAPYRHKTLPPIHPQQQQQQRRNGSVPTSNKSDPLLENHRRIARFIKNIK